MDNGNICDIKCPVCGCRSFSYTRVLTYTSELNSKVEVGTDGKPVVGEDGLQSQSSTVVTCMYCGTQIHHAEAILDRKQDNNELNLI